MREPRDDLDDTAEVAPAGNAPPDGGGTVTSPPHDIDHYDIPIGPTRGYHPNVWGYQFELLVEGKSIALTEDQQLQLHDTYRFAKRMVWSTAVTREAFQWQVRNGLLEIRKMADGHRASPNLVALASLLRKQQELERGGARGPAIAALRYFSMRHAVVGSAWLGFVLGQEGTEAGVFGAATLASEVQP